MRRCLGLMAVAVSLSLSSLSCGGDAPATTLYPARGKVTYNGQAAGGANLTFQPDGPASLSKQGNAIVPSATSGDDGTFSIACPGLGDGIPAGKYKVLVSWSPPPKSSGAKLLAARKKKPAGYDPNALFSSDPFDGRYSNPSKPLLTAEVKSESNDFLFELKD